MTVPGVRDYYVQLNPRFISWEYYSQYAYQPAPFGSLGAIVFVRTYSRYIDFLKRRETWAEVCLRWIEWSFSLDKITPFDVLKKKAERTFYYAFNMKAFPAGRTLWIGGTEISKKFFTANFNCSANLVDSLTKPVEGFVKLMLGAGYGFSLRKKDVEKIPEFCTTNILKHLDYKDFNLADSLHPDIKKIAREEILGKKENTELHYDNKKLEFTLQDLHLDDHEYYNKVISLIGSNLFFREIKIVVGDDKFAWANALRLVLVSYTIPDLKVSIDYNYIRPEGATLKTFGGRASGYLALRRLFENIDYIVKRSDIKGLRKLSTLDWLDINNSMGLAVVVGGVRRSSELCGFDEGDELEKAKYNLWIDVDNEGLTTEEILAIRFRQQVRVQSNNSIFLDNNSHNNDVEFFRNKLEIIRNNGEPSFYNWESARTKIARILQTEQGLSYEEAKEKANLYLVTNPCGEIFLRDRGLCNLVEVVLSRFIVDGRFVDFIELEEAIKLITEHNVRVTLGDQWHPEWTKTQHESRLLGVGITGYEDLADALEYGSEERISIEKTLHMWARQYANDYCDLLGINRPDLVTTVKPSGTLSQLPTCSSGCHKSYAPYYIRRIRISKNDPLAKVIKDMGIPLMPENNQGYHEALEHPELLDYYLTHPNCNTWVMSIPVKTNAKKNAYHESALDQLERYKSLYLNYAEHNPSITVYLKNEDKVYDEVAEWLASNFYNFAGISFLPEYAPFPQMAYEEISEEEYYQRIKSIPNPSEHDLIKKLMDYEVVYEEQELDLSAQCNTGACPIR